MQVAHTFQCSELTTGRRQTSETRRRTETHTQTVRGGAPHGASSTLPSADGLGTRDSGVRLRGVCGVCGLVGARRDPRPPHTPLTRVEARSPRYGGTHAGTIRRVYGGWNAPRLQDPVPVG